ncbi:MAG: DUF2281 domain-containing protein [Methyloglobulus sp.]|nr:DUF2281 domain-containing protein [Methyloglobulus sp.]
MPTVDLSTLPANAQQELLDFYEFLQKKYARKTVSPEVSVLHQQLTQVDFKTFMISIFKMVGIEFDAATA